MGGHAFPNLNAPRLPPALYHRLCERYCGSGTDTDKKDTVANAMDDGGGVALLSKYFDRVAVPIPGPEKTDHGDVDVCVCGFRGVGGGGVDGEKWKEGNIVELLSLVLGATAVRAKGKGTGGIFAVPLLEEDDLALLPPTPKTNTASSPPQPQPQPHFQLDITITPPHIFTWTLFHASHSDLWDLLGTTIRPFGLTVTDTGLHVRVPAIEAFDRKRSRVFLTREPREVMGFLGYENDEEGMGMVEREFKSLERMFWFVARGRFFRRGGFEGLGSGDGDCEEEERRGEGGAAGSGDGGGEKKGGKSNARDRKRLLKREGYRRFICEWVPALPPVVNTTATATIVNPSKQETEQEQVMTRETVLEEALETFGKREEYMDRLRVWENERRELELRRRGREERKKGCVGEGGGDGGVC